MPDPIDRNRPFAKPGPWITPLNSGDEAKFQDWVKTNKVPFDPSPTSDYDMRGYWKDVASQGDNLSGKNPVDGRLHFSDSYKTPYHESFSDESSYSTPSNPFHWEGETLKDSRTGKPVYETKPMPDDNKIPLEPWVSDYIDKTGQVPTMHIFLNPHETGNPESKPTNQAPPSAYPDIEADHTQQKVQDQHIATGVFSPEDAKPEDLEAAQTAQAFGWSTDTELKLAQAHRLVNQAGEAMSGAVPSSMQEVAEHPIVSALKTAGFAIDPVGAMGATIGGQATDALVDKYVPQATNPMLHPVLKTASGLIGGILGGGVAGGAKKAVTSSIVDEAGNPMVAASETLSPEAIAEQTRSPQAQLESYSKALQSHLENPNDEEFRNLKPGTILNAEDTANLNIKTNTRIDNLTKLAKAYMATTTPEEKEQVLNMFKQEMVPTAQIIKSGLGVAAEHGRALAWHNTDWSAAKDVGALLAGKPDQDWDSFIRAMSTMEPNEATAGKMGPEISSQIGFNFGGKALQGGGHLDADTVAKWAARRASHLQAISDYLTAKPGDPVVLRNLEHDLTETGQGLLDLGVPIGSGQMLLNLTGQAMTSKGIEIPKGIDSPEVRNAADKVYSLLNKPRLDRSKALIGQWLGKTNNMAYKALVNSLLLNPRIVAAKIATDAMYQPLNITAQAIATGVRFKSPSAGARMWLGSMQATFGAIADAWKFAKMSVKSGAPEFQNSIGDVNDPRIFAEDFESNTIPGKAFGWLSSAFGIGTRTVTGTDQFAKTTAYRAGQHAQAFYRAMEEFESNNPTAATAYANASKLAEAYIAENPKWLQEASESEMYKNTFTDEDYYTQKAKQLTNAVPFMKLVSPMQRTPINLLEQGMMSTPFAPLTAKFWQETGEGGLARDTALTKLAVGSVMWGWMVHEAAKGNIIGSPPTDPTAREIFHKQYGEGEGIRHDGTFYSVKHLGPLGEAMIHAANFAQYGGQMPWNDFQAFGTAGAKAMAHVVANAPLLEPLMNTMSALGEGLKAEQAGKSLKPLTKLGGRIAASFIPAPLKIAADAMDPHLHEVRGVWDSSKNKLPGFGTPSTLDQFAEPQFLSPGAGPDDEAPSWMASVMNSISPIPIYHDREPDAVDKEILRTGFKASRAPDAIWISDPKLPIPIDPEAKHRWGMIAGKELKLRPLLGAGGPMNQHDNIETMINNKHYQDIANSTTDPDIAKYRQAQEIEKVHRLYMEQARKRLLQERPDLAAMAIRRYNIENPNPNHPAKTLADIGMN